MNARNSVMKTPVFVFFLTRIERLDSKLLFTIIFTKAQSAI